MPDLARIRKLLKPPRPLANSTSTSRPREGSPVVEEEAGDWEILNEADEREDARIGDDASDPDVPVEVYAPARNDFHTQGNQDATPPPARRRGRWNESGARDLDEETGFSKNGAPHNLFGGLSITLTPEDATEILDAIEYGQSQEAWLVNERTMITDLARKQDGTLGLLVRKLRDQKESSESSAAKRQAEHDAEKDKIQGEAQANLEAARARIRELESEVRRMMEDQKQLALEIEKSQLLHADAEQRSRLAQRRSRQERESYELDVQQWRQWGEENERKLQACKDESRINNARILSRRIGEMKLFQALKAHAKAQRKRIRGLGEQLQQYRHESITMLPEIDFATRKLMEIVNNAEKVMTTVLESLPNPDSSLGLSNSDNNNDSPVDYCGSLLANLHIIDDSTCVRSSASPSFRSSPSTLISPKSEFKVESRTWPSSPTQSSPDLSIPSDPSHQARSGPEIPSSRRSSTMQRSNSWPLVGFTGYNETDMPNRFSQMEWEMITEYAKAQIAAGAGEEYQRFLKAQAEAQELAEHNLSLLRQAREEGEWKKRMGDRKFAAAQQKWKERIEWDERWERQRKRRAEAASYEELRTWAKRIKRSDEEVHALVTQLPGGFPEDPGERRMPWLRVQRVPSVRRPRKPLSQPRRLTAAQLAVCKRVGRYRDICREKRGIAQSKRKLRRLHRELAKKLRAQARMLGQPEPVIPEFKLPTPRLESPTPKPESPTPGRRKVRFLDTVTIIPAPNYPASRSVSPPVDRAGPDIANSSRFGRVIRFLRARPLAIFCTIMTTACAVKWWRLSRYEQEYLNANDVPQSIQDMIRAEIQSWEWLKVLEYELLKGQDRTRLG